MVRSSEVVRDGMFGPNLTASASMLTGAFHLSRRFALEMVNTVFDGPMSLGGLSNCEEETTEALAASVSEIGEAVLFSPVVHADETSSRLENRMKGWLWVAVGGRRQYCWAHVKRDFTRISEMPGESGEIDRALLDAESRLFVLLS